MPLDLMISVKIDCDLQYRLRTSYRPTSRNETKQKINKMTTKRNL